MDNWNESKLFQYLKDNYYPDLIKSKDKMSAWDCYSKIQNHLIELKCRSKHFDELIIEKKKYDSLIEITQGKSTIPIYICSTPSGVFRYNLRNLDLRWNCQPYRKTTHFAESKKINKFVSYINVRKADKL